MPVGSWSAESQSEKISVFQETNRIVSIVKPRSRLSGVFYALKCFGIDGWMVMDYNESGIMNWEVII